MLEIAKIQRELIADPDIYIFFEKGTSGGISYIFNRYSKPKINIWNLMTQNKNQNVWYI